MRFSQLATAALAAVVVRADAVEDVKEAASDASSSAASVVSSATAAVSKPTFTVCPQPRVIKRMTTNSYPAHNHQRSSLPGTIHRRLGDTVESFARKEAERQERGYRGMGIRRQLGCRRATCPQWHGWRQRSCRQGQGCPSRYLGHFQQAHQPKEAAIGYPI